MMHCSTFSINILSRQIGLHVFQKNAPACLLAARHLYTPSALGIDGYLQARERIRMQFNEMADRFRMKMKDFVSPKSVNMVFTEDLKHMVHIAEGNEEDLELIESMIIKFNNQNKDLRFGSYIFGPVVMRMYHHLNRPKEALQMFKHPDTDGFFDQIITYQLLMDLLLENKMYDEAMEIMDIVKNKQIPASRFPRNIVVLAMAAAYKKNTPESLQYVKSLWAELQDAGHQPMRRAITFAAALAINQNAPHIALELLSEVPKQNYVTIRNLRVLALADVNRPDDALPILRSVLEMEGPHETKHTFCSEVVKKVKAAVASADKDVQQECERIVDQLTKLGHITDEPLDNQLCMEIEKSTFPPQSRDRTIMSAKFDSRDRRPQRGFQRTRRPGLQDMD